MSAAESPYPAPPEISAIPGPSIARRRSLPTGRAVIGALLVTLAAIGLFTAYRQAVGEPDTQYVVVARPVEAGARIGVGDVRVDAIELPDGIAPTVFGDASTVVGAVAITPLGEGQLLQRSDVLLLAPGEAADDPPWREFSFTIASARAVDGQIRPGERVDLIATYTTSGDTDTVVVFRDAPVLRRSESTDGLLASTGGLVITVALDDPASVLAAVNAVDDAQELTVIRATKVDGQELPSTFSFEPAADTEADG